jgi:predicted nucleotidyltransferase
LTPAEVIARRRAQRAALLSTAAAFAQQLDPALDVRAVVVVGSVARGDFHAASDLDVLVVADGLPERPLDRLLALGRRPPGVQPVAWTTAEWHAQRARDNPIAVEAQRDGVWVRGQLADL